MTTATHNTTVEITPQKRRLVMAVLLFGAFLAVLNQTIMVSALPSVMVEYDVSANTAQLLISFFMLVNGIMVPVTAFLIHRFTNRQLFIASMGFLCLGSIIAVIGNNFGLVLFGRVIQAIGAGITMPLMQTMIMYIFPKEKRGYAMGIMGIVISFAPAIGPTISGIIVDLWGWHYIFYMMIPLSLLMIIATYFGMQNLTERQEHTMDTPSLILSTIGFGGLLYCCSMAGVYSMTDMHTLLPLAIGIIGLILFFIREFSIKNPMLDLHVLKSKTFLFGTIMSMMSFGLMIGVENLVPQYMQTARGEAATITGLILLPGAMITAFLSPITGRVFDRFGPRPLALTGTSLMIIGTSLMLTISKTSSIALLCIWYTIRMVGTTMVTMPLTTWGLNSLDNHLLAHGTATNTTFRQMAGSISMALMVTIMTTGAARAAAGSPLMDSADALISGIKTSLIVATILCCLLFIIALFLVFDYDNIAAIHRHKREDAQN